MTGAPASRAALAALALELIDRDGPAGLTHTSLARASGLEVDAVRGRLPADDDLADLVVEAVVGGHQPLALEDEPADWGLLLRQIGLAYRRMLLLHPKAFEYLVARPARSAAALEVIERYMVALTDRGLDEPHALAAFNAVVVWTHGYVLSELQAGAPAERPLPDMTGHPYLARAVSQTTWGLPDGEYAFGLDALVEGLRAGIAE